MTQASSHSLTPTTGRNHLLDSSNMEGGGGEDREQRLLPADTQGGGVCDSDRT
jgi:hypothetical protein